MEGKKRYHTRQRNEILYFFQTHAGKWFSAREVISSAQIAAGNATVFRCLTAMAEEGKLVRTIPKPGAGAIYRYHEKDIPNAPCRLTCVKCGQSVNLRCSFLDDMARHIENDHAFFLDNEKTVLFGVCRDCGRDGEHRTYGRRA